MSDEAQHLRWLLEKCREKLAIYRAQVGDEYTGGMEYRMLRMELDKTLDPTNLTGGK